MNREAVLEAALHDAQDLAIALGHHGIFNTCRKAIATPPDPPVVPDDRRFKAACAAMEGLIGSRDYDLRWAAEHCWDVGDQMLAAEARPNE